MASITIKPEAAVPTTLPFEPLPAYTGLLHKDAELANCQGKKIGILIVTYNALTTLTRVLKRISPSVWDNVEEVAVFDDASQDATYELAVGLKTLTIVAQAEYPEARKESWLRRKSEGRLPAFHRSGF